MLFNLLKVTLIQTSLSTLISLCLGLILARILFYNPRPWMDRVLGVSLVMPSLSLVVGITSLLGETVHNLYGLTRIVICHLYLNIPLAILIVLNAYRSLPQSIWQLTATLRLPKMTSFLKIEFPLLQTVLCRTAGVIFLYCFSSFTIPLMMGGSPNNNTLTVALYYDLVVRGNFHESMILPIHKNPIPMTKLGIMIISEDNLSSQIRIRG